VTTELAKTEPICRIGELKRRGDPAQTDVLFVSVMVSIGLVLLTFANHLMLLTKHLVFECGREVGESV